MMRIKRKTVTAVLLVLNMVAFGGGLLVQHTTAATVQGRRG